MRKCKSCGITQEVKLFPSAGIVKSKQYYRHLCTQCYSKTKSDRRKNIRKEFLEYKKTLVCNRCNFDDYRALQFHHTRDKVLEIANTIKNGWSLKRIMTEVDKCEVLCANCHQIEHFSK